LPPHRHLSRAGNDYSNQNENSQTDFYDYTIAHCDSDSSNATADPNVDADPQTDPATADANADQTTRADGTAATDCIAISIRHC
jgi:hypothetical protein